MVWIFGEIIENSDFSCIINIEKKKSTGQYYLTFKRIKLRYRDPNDDIYFNHPFEIGNRMRLIDDFLLDRSLSEKSLTDLEPVKFGRGKRTISKIDDDSEGDDLFDFSNEIK